MHLEAVRCLVTAGPTIEPLDEVRRLTNHSTGCLGCQLADALARAGHQVTLLLSETARHRPRQKSIRIISFNTTSELHHQLRTEQSTTIRAVFHAAAVSDFRVCRILNSKTRRPIKAGKIPTQQGRLLLELAPTPKIIRQLRRWFPKAKIVGWKYEVDGSHDAALAKAREQIKRCHTNACVANGPGYGEGFGLVTNADTTHHSSALILIRSLIRTLP